MATRRTKKLLVEGKDDEHAIRALIAAHVPWPETPSAAPVVIESRDGIDGLLNPATFSAELKSSDSDTLGVVIDANDDCNRRWTRIRDRCKDAFPDLPHAIPQTGLDATNAQGRRLGVWIMPDNRSSGMLETFLGHIVESEADSVWRYAQRVVPRARRLGAPLTPAEEAKATLHTWLAWQSPPGKPFGVAIKFKMLDPISASASDFVAWFKRLYELDEPATQ